MKKILLASAAIMTLSSGAALALDDTTTVGLQYMEEEIGNVDVVTEQLVIDGDRGDFQYNFALGMEDQGAIEGERFNADVVWTGLDLGHGVTFGPKFTYLSADYNNIGQMDSTWAGVAAKIEKDMFQITGYAQTELRERKDDWTLGLRTDVAVTDNFMINGEIARTEFDNNTATDFKVGGRYTMDKYYGEAGVKANELNGVDGQGYYVGLGLSF